MFLLLAALHPELSFNKYLLSTYLLYAVLCSRYWGNWCEYDPYSAPCSAWAITAIMTHRDRKETISDTSRVISATKETCTCYGLEIHLTKVAGVAFTAAVRVTVECGWSREVGEQIVRKRKEGGHCWQLLETWSGKSYSTAVWLSPPPRGVF